MSVRGVPAQELPENQAPEVAYNLIEQTGEKIPLELGEQVDPGEPPAEPIKRRGRKAKAGAEPVAEEAVAEESGVAGVEVAALRQLGS